MGDDRVKNWLTSLIISILFGFFVTLPIQVIKRKLNLYFYPQIYLTYAH
jgi:hypothetical protein